MGEFSLSLIHISGPPQHPPFSGNTSVSGLHTAVLELLPLCFFTQTSLAKLKFCLDKLPSEKTPHTAIDWCSVKNLSWKEALNKVDLFNFFFFYWAHLLASAGRKLNDF